MSNLLARCSITFSVYLLRFMLRCRWHSRCAFKTSAEFVSSKWHLCNPQRACFRFNFCERQKNRHRYLLDFSFF